MHTYGNVYSISLYKSIFLYTSIFRFFEEFLSKLFGAYFIAYFSLFGSPYLKMYCTSVRVTQKRLRLSASAVIWKSSFQIFIFFLQSTWKVTMGNTVFSKMLMWSVLNCTLEEIASLAICQDVLEILKYMYHTRRFTWLSMQTMLCTC